MNLDSFRHLGEVNCTMSRSLEHQSASCILEAALGNVKRSLPSGKQESESIRLVFVVLQQANQLLGLEEYPKDGDMFVFYELQWIRSNIGHWIVGRQVLPREIIV